MILTGNLFADITGYVFNDKNINSVHDFDSEYKISDIEIDVYNSDNDLIQTVVTDINGEFNINIDEGTSVRLHIITNDIFEISSNFNGSSSGIQFITSPAKVLFPLTNKNEYCGSSPKLTTSCFVTGDPINGSDEIKNSDSLVIWDYFLEGQPKTDSRVQMPNILSIAKEIGSTWGVAYQKSSKTIFTSSVLKRHAGLGPMGLSGIYSININDIDNPTVSNFIDLSTIGIDVGSVVRNDGDLSLDGNADKDIIDPNVAKEIGLKGIGDIEVSVDNKSLYFINLFDKTLYQLDIGLDANIPTTSNISKFKIENPGCSNNEYIPWATKTNNTDVYVGVTCTAKTSQDSNDLKSYILKLDQDLGTFNSILEIPLNYKRTKVVAVDAFPTNDADWNPWFDDELFLAPLKGQLLAYPIPLLTDIEIDEKGNFILGIMDAFGLKTAYGQFIYKNEAEKTDITWGLTAGDILKACNDSGNLVLESNAGCGSDVTLGKDTASGIDNGEFFYQDDYTVHSETAIGSLALLPESNEVITTVYDPFDFDSGGVKALDLTTGESLRNFELYNSESIGNFGKGVGLGDIELICEEPPIEIGNLVWCDDNVNGIQDANEKGIEGVEVLLICQETGEVIGKTETNIIGNYVFGGESNLNILDNKMLEKGKSYTLKINLDDPFLNGKVPTLKNTIDDVIDSDGMLMDNMSVITLSTTEKVSDQNYDFGFFEYQEIGNYVWYDKDRNGDQDKEERVIPDVTVSLICKESKEIISQTVTDKNGEYYFDSYDGLVPNKDYKICLDYDSDYTTGNLSGLGLTIQNTTDDAADSDAMSVEGQNCIMYNAEKGVNDYTLDTGFIMKASEFDLTKIQHILDGNAKDLNRLVNEAAEWREKDRGKSCSIRKRQSIRTLVKKAEELYENAWNIAWVNLQGVDYVFEDKSIPFFCENVNNSKDLAYAIDTAKQIREIVYNLSGGTCALNNSRANTLYERSSKVNRSIIDSLKSYPVETVDCK